MSNKQSERIAILRAALEKITENKKKIGITKEDIDEASDKFIAYTNLTLESKKLQEDIASLSVKQSTVAELTAY